MKMLFEIMITTLIATESPRQLLLFCKSSGLTKQKSQMAIFDAHQKDMMERDINLQRFPMRKYGIKRGRGSNLK